MSTFGWLLQPAVLPWVALALGLCIGSFLNVVIHRLPKMMEREWRAECADCGHAITALENIPLASYLALRGKCSACGARIGIKYPLVELLAGLAAAYSAWRFGPSLAALGAALFVWFTIALAFIDQETGFLPDTLTLLLVWIGLVLNVAGAFVPLPEAVIGAAAGYLSLWLVYWGYKLLTGKDGMGYGDFKMNAAVGAFLGWKMLPLVILLSSLVGLAFGALQMFAARGRWDAGFRFHFGPYLAIAGVVALYWGDPIVRWYVQRL
ncbi:MAG: prepilin peptidase [Betaproteobacteria bacterium]|nr:MAG: prepilin peptidase [Betaproteobacteria bacterium]